jgi:hypothetical protein
VSWGIALRAAWEATGEQKYIDRGYDFWERVAVYQDEHDGDFPHHWSFQDVCDSRACTNLVGK